MQSIGQKQDNDPQNSDGVLTAAEFNSFITDLMNLITSTGQSLSTGDLYQFAKGVATYAVTGTYFLDSGVANTYTLSVPGTRQAPAAYTDGMRVRFFAANSNTGGSTVNCATLGSKAVNRPDGTALQAGDISAGTEVELTFRNSLNYFVLSQNVKVTGNQTIFDTKSFNSVPNALADPSGGNDLVRYSFLQSYVATNSNSIPSGSMMSYPGSSAPTGYLFAYGQAISRTTYANLFTAYGSTHGSGDGTTTFNVPDMRGRGAFGKDNMGGSAANRIAANGTTLGASGGAETHTQTIAEMPNHNHNLGMYQGTEPGNNRLVGGGASPIATDFTGGGTAMNIMNPYFVSNIIIKV